LLNCLPATAGLQTFHTFKSADQKSVADFGKSSPPDSFHTMSSMCNRLSSERSSVIKFLFCARAIQFSQLRQSMSAGCSAVRLLGLQEGWHGCASAAPSKSRPPSPWRVFRALLEGGWFFGAKLTGCVTFPGTRILPSLFPGFSLPKTPMARLAVISDPPSVLRPSILSTTTTTLIWQPGNDSDFARGKFAGAGAYPPEREKFNHSIFANTLPFSTSLSWYENSLFSFSFFLLFGNCRVDGPFRSLRWRRPFWHHSCPAIF